MTIIFPPKYLYICDRRVDNIGVKINLFCSKSFYIISSTFDQLVKYGMYNHYTKYTNGYNSISLRKEHFKNSAEKYENEEILVCVQYIYNVYY